MLRVKAAFSKQPSEAQSILFDRIDELASDRLILLAALKRLASAGGSVFRTVDGSLVMRDSAVKAFDQAREQALIVISQAETTESR
ncbi:hypothetical protein EGT09_02155 [Pseudomonas putida]|nr:hypothetical protein EGT09_02155 [Pseudomonas putida]